MEKDTEILRSGPVCMYFKNEILNEDIRWFENNQYEVIDTNVRSWNKKNYHLKIKESLNFPDYYGENLNAFSDCLGDMYNERYKGLVLVFRDYDEFVKEYANIAEAILDIIARKSRVWLLTGQRLITLVQSKDGDLHFENLGGTDSNWNGAEWLIKDRE